MAKPLSSEFPAASSAPSSQHARPKHLGLHELNLRGSCASTIAPVISSRDDEPYRAETFDSDNFEAARQLMAEREESGLTLEEAAYFANVSVPTVWRRENNKVDLGPLKQLIALKKARAAKFKVVK